MEGVIIKNISNNYVVKCNNGTYQCRARGKFRNEKRVPLVGDRVIINEHDCYILEILNRKNELVRPSVSNVDQAIIVTSVKEPVLDTYLLDKLLTIISFHEIEAVICFSKLDLLTDQELKDIQRYMNYYEKLGYTVVTNEKRENFLNLFKGKITVLTGQSGVGKSSLLNLLDEKLNLQTNQISYALNRGKHTTRHTELYEVLDGYIVDTPGFSQVDFHDMDRVAIRDNMKEMFDYLEYCKYRDCMHLKEDGCYVKKMVDGGIILKSRYENYKSFINGKGN